MSVDQNRELELQSLCRICLQLVNSTQEKITAFFPETQESKEILNNIYLCFKVTLPNDKHLPNFVCYDCVNELNNANKFRLKCITVDERFKLYCKNQVKKSTCKTEIDCNDKPDYEENGCDAPCNDYYEYNNCDNKVLKTHEKADENKIYKNGVTNIFKCDLCNKVLKTKITLLKHHISMHNKRKHKGQVSGFGAARRYHCTTCSYSTPHSQTLVSHMRTHNGERPYTCECGKSFTQSSSLSAHRKSHSSTTYFTCSLCGKQFKHAFTMKNHMRVHENPIFSCSICFKSLKSKETLQAHMHRHYKICNFSCEDCGDTFVTSAELHNHRKKHSMQKNIECHLCGYKTNTKKNLVIHLKRHTGNRSIKCDMCHVRFYRKSDLRRHMRVHTGEKPYSCLTCGQKFSYSPSLNKHMKTIHGVNYKWSEWKQTKVKLPEKGDKNVPSSTKELICSK